VVRTFKNQHATKNILKIRESLIDGALIFKPSTPSSNFHEPIAFISNSSASLDSRLFLNDNEKLMTKAKMLYS
jgi:hypothetical protein